MITKLLRRNKPKKISQLPFNNPELTNQLKPDAFTINAFFTCFADYEHAGQFGSEKLGSDDLLDFRYFGLVENTSVTMTGVQTKNLYALVEFINDNNLWPSQLEPLPHVDGEGEKSPFRRVIEALDATPDKHSGIGKAFRTYPLALINIAYVAVGEVGVENLKGVQPITAGRMALEKIHKHTKKRPLSRKMKFLLIGLPFLLIGGWILNYARSGLSVIS